MSNQYDLKSTVDSIAANYDAEEIFFTDPSHCFPNRGEVVQLINDIRRLMFPRYFGNEIPTGTNPQYFIGNMLIQIEDMLHRQLRQAFGFAREKGEICADADVDQLASDVCDHFMSSLPKLQETIMKDVQAAFDGDPAAQSKEEIIFSYPGFYAIFVYRLAHELYVKKVPLIPRIMTEYAHAQTGVDINSGAVIGEYFFIDHATGVVIGETTHIGNHVKVYQGVTLGALSTRGGQRLSGVQRHPTIEDDVTIYSNASILGGETIIGRGSIIGGNAFVTESVPPNSRVYAVTENVSKVKTPHPDNWCKE